MRDRFEKLGKSIPKRNYRDIERDHHDILERFREDRRKDLNRDWDQVETQSEKAS